MRKRFPMVSRATVYNTLNLFVEKRLLRAFVLAPGRIVFDPKTDAHHHFIDERTGEIMDVPWDAVDVTRRRSSARLRRPRVPGRDARPPHAAALMPFFVAVA